MRATFIPLRWPVLLVLFAGSACSGNPSQVDVLTDAPVASEVDDATDAGPDCQAWTWSTSAVPVDQLSSPGTVAFDGSGRLHLFYQQRVTPGETSQFVHAVRADDGQWTSEVVGEGVYPGTVVVSADGVAHVAYSYESYTLLTGPRVHYATNASGTWREEEVARAHQANLALDKAGRPVLVHALFKAQGVRIGLSRRGDDGTWSHEDPVDLEGAGLPLLTLGPGDQPVLGFSRLHDNDGSRPWISRLVGGTWTSEWLPDPWPAGMGMDGLWSLVVEPTGGLRLSFLAQVDNLLRVAYADNLEGSWRVDVLDLVVPGSVPSLALDAQGRPHVFYLGPWTGETSGAALRHAVRVDGAWSLEQIATFPVPDALTFLLMGPQGAAVAGDGQFVIGWLREAAPDAIQLASSPGSAIAPCPAPDVAR